MGFVELFACRLSVHYSTLWREGRGHETLISREAVLEE